MKVYELVPAYLPVTQNWLYDLFNNTKVDKIVTLENLGNSQFETDKLICHRKSGKKPNLISKILYLFSIIIRQLSYKNIVFHSHFGDFGYRNSQFMLKRKDIKHVVSLYGYDISELLLDDVWKSRLIDLFQNRCDKILVLGSEMKKTVEELGTDSKKIEIFHLGIDLNEVSFHKRSFDKNGAINFVILSSFNPKKGILDSINAFKRLKKEYPNIKLDIIGDSYSSDPVMVNYKKDIIDLIGDDKSIIRHGFLKHDEVTKVLETSHIMLHPSKTDFKGNKEGTPVAILKAMASGVLVLSTFHSDIPDIIDDGLEGLLVEEGDVDGICHKIEKVLNDPEYYDSLINGARRKIEESFNIRKQGSNLENIYRDLFNDKQ